METELCLVVYVCRPFLSIGLISTHIVLLCVANRGVFLLHVAFEKTIMKKKTLYTIDGQNLFTFIIRVNMSKM